MGIGAAIKQPLLNERYWTGYTKDILDHTNTIISFSKEGTQVFLHVN